MKMGFVRFLASGLLALLLMAVLSVLCLDSESSVGFYWLLPGLYLSNLADWLGVWPMAHGWDAAGQWAWSSLFIWWSVLWVGLYVWLTRRSRRTRALPA